MFHSATANTLPVAGWLASPMFDQSSVRMVRPLFDL